MGSRRAAAPPTWWAAGCCAVNGLPRPAEDHKDPNKGSILDRPESDPEPKTAVLIPTPRGLLPPFYFFLKKASPGSPKFQPINSLLTPREGSLSLPLFQTLHSHFAYTSHLPPPPRGSGSDSVIGRFQPRPKPATAAGGRGSGADLSHQVGLQPGEAARQLLRQRQRLRVARAVAAGVPLRAAAVATRGISTPSFTPHMSLDVHIMCVYACTQKVSASEFAIPTTRKRSFLAFGAGSAKKTAILCGYHVF